MLAAAGTARARAEPFLSVTRGDGAESCPDAARLIARVEQLRGRPETGASGAYAVRFTRGDDGFRASIRSGSGARELRDRGGSCAALEQATAVTLALLLDSDAREPPLQAPEADVGGEPAPAPGAPAAAAGAPAPAAGAPSPQASAAVPPAPRVPSGAGGGEREGEAPGPEGGATRLTLAAGATGLFGVVRPFAPALSAEVGIGGARWRATMGALWLVPQTLRHGPGELRETLLGGAARACFAAAGSEALRFDVCSGIHAGWLQVAASGYTRNDVAEKAWLAVPLELSLSRLSGPLGFDVGAAALLPLRRNDFSVDGVGVAYSSPPIGALVSLRGVGVWVL
ncbi:hypothetical protein SOCE836_008360 [Sorangium cellulosum]|uniref:Uncharacterized protein n=2 Tax=Polyangiaceae TaxID=49 RepID=A0A4P2QFY7_SORCE|nr:hypothetical protein SOCE836_008360 [Sorangium cellulosum]WCQ88152.1 hypothetical protein NQZ70_00824 [Sorangium sp. Soce836]